MLGEDILLYRTLHTSITPPIHFTDRLPCARQRIVTGPEALTKMPMSPCPQTADLKSQPGTFRVRGLSQLTPGHPFAPAPLQSTSHGPTHRLYNTYDHPTSHLAVTADGPMCGYRTLMYLPNLSLCANSPSCRTECLE